MEAINRVVAISSSSSASNSDHRTNKHSLMLDYLDTFKGQKESFESRINKLPPDSQKRLERKLLDKRLMNTVTISVMNIPVSVHGEFIDLATALELLSVKQPAVMPQYGYLFNYEDIQPELKLKANIEEEITIAENEAILSTSSSSNSFSHVIQNVSSLSSTPQSLLEMESDLYAAQFEMAKVQYELGLMYQNGCGVSQDNTEAAKWFQRATKGLFYLGYVYETGHGVPLDLVKATKYYRWAADLDYAKAQFRLALLLVKGYPGMQPNPAEAAKYFRLAAEQNCPNALERLYKMSQEDLPEALEQLGILYETGCGGLVQNYSLAMACYQRVVRIDWPRGNYRLGLMSENGRGVPKNYLTAIRYYFSAAKHGFIAALESLLRLAAADSLISEQDRCEHIFVDLGIMYAQGEGVPQDNAQAVKYFSHAAKKNDRRALYELYNMAGLGNADALNELREIAANNIQAQIKLALLFIQGGPNIPSDLVEAEKWLEKIGPHYNSQYSSFQSIALDDYKKALFLLGKAYKNGQGVPQNDAQAAKYFSQAAKENHADALQELYNMASLGNADALNEFRQTAANNIKAKVALALLLIQGYESVPPNPVEAEKLFEEADAYYKCQSSFPQEMYLGVYRKAQFLLGMAYKEGQRVSQNDVKAVKYLSQAAAGGYKTAQFLSGVAYQKGCGVLKNVNEAAKYFSWAARQKHEDACQKLELMFVEGYEPPFNADSSLTAAFLSWKVRNDTTNSVSQSSSSSTQGPPQKRRRVNEKSEIEQNHSSFYSSSQATAPNDSAGSSSMPSTPHGKK